MHHLCNLIHVKSSEAAAFLEKRGYGQTRDGQLIKGWKCYCQWRQCESLRPDVKSDGSLVGSRSQVLLEEGKYPYELSAADYKRALGKEYDFLEQVILEQNEDGFAEKENRRAEYCFRRAKVKSAKFPFAQDTGILGDAQRERLDEEDIILRQKIRELEKDEVFVWACMYSGIDGRSMYTPEQLREKQQRIVSSNYQMWEYRYYRRLFRTLLKYDPCVYFTYTDEDERERTDFRLVKSLTLDELKIGDLAMLCSYDVLKICRNKGKAVQG